MLLKEVSNAYQCCIHLIKNSNMMKYYKITFEYIFKYNCIPVMAKLNLQQLLLQFSVSHVPSEMIVICWFGARETFSY